MNLNVTGVMFLHLIWSLPMYICMYVCMYVYMYVCMHCVCGCRHISYIWASVFELFPIGICFNPRASFIRWRRVPYQLNQVVSFPVFLWVIAFIFYHFFQRLISSCPYRPVTIKSQYKCCRFNLMVMMGAIGHYIDIIFKYMQYKLML
jgi:hypothetical protein